MIISIAIVKQQARNAAERLAAALMHTPLSGGLPETGMIRGWSDLVPTLRGQRARRSSSSRLVMR